MRWDYAAFNGKLKRIRILKTLILLVLITTNCSAQNNFKEYYFPFGKSKEIKVYKYVDKKNPNKVEYWKVTTHPETNHLLTESYTSDFQLYNIFEEVINSEGAELIKYTNFEENENGQNIKINATIIDKDVIKWNDDDKYKYSVKYEHPKYGNEKFIKERKKNITESLSLNGTEYSTIKFLDEYEIKSIDHNESFRFFQFTYYAKNLGMIKYLRIFPNGSEVELELSDILTEIEFNKLLENASR